jgi:hypothetical protein
MEHIKFEKRYSFRHHSSKTFPIKDIYITVIMKLLSFQILFMWLKNCNLKRN